MRGRKPQPTALRRARRNPGKRGYRKAYGHWVEAEEQMQKTPAMLKTPSGYVQQSPWLSVANKQLELMGRFMTELGMTPAARTRVAALKEGMDEGPVKIELVTRFVDAEDDRPVSEAQDRRRIVLDDRL